MGRQHSGKRYPKMLWKGNIETITFEIEKMMDTYKNHRSVVVYTNTFQC